LETSRQHFVEGDAVDLKPFVRLRVVLTDPQAFHLHTCKFHGQTGLGKKNS
jgi:hypothetical protein